MNRMIEKSIQAAGAEGDENKAGGDRKHNEHPVLAVEAKEKCSTRKCNVSAPPMFWGKIGGLLSETYYFYISPGDTAHGAVAWSVGGQVLEAGLKAVADTGFRH